MQHGTINYIFVCSKADSLSAARNQKKTERVPVLKKVKNKKPRGSEETVRS